MKLIPNDRSFRGAFGDCVLVLVGAEGPWKSGFIGRRGALA